MKKGKTLSMLQELFKWITNICLLFFFNKKEGFAGEP